MICIRGLRRLYGIVVEHILLHLIFLFVFFVLLFFVLITQTQSVRQIRFLFQQSWHVMLWRRWQRDTASSLHLKRWLFAEERIDVDIGIAAIFVKRSRRTNDGWLGRPCRDVAICQHVCVGLFICIRPRSRHLQQHGIILSYPLHGLAVLMIGMHSFTYQRPIKLCVDCSMLYRLVGSASHCILGRKFGHRFLQFLVHLLQERLSIFPPNRVLVQRALFVVFAARVQIVAQSIVECAYAASRRMDDRMIARSAVVVEIEVVTACLVVIIHVVVGVVAVAVIDCGIRCSAKIIQIVVVSRRVWL
mmetsp:Transcript_63094/g.100282  ORF Transcript_63094/g.100282 Transcript_63094/m.100282 type:complete len:303 (-) Transcript_63094:184-1092(-)